MTQARILSLFKSTQVNNFPKGFSENVVIQCMTNQKFELMNLSSVPFNTSYLPKMYLWDLDIEFEGLLPLQLDLHVVNEIVFTSIHKSIQHLGGISCVENNLD